MNPTLANPSQQQPSALSINPANLSAASTLGGTHPRLQPATPSSDAARRSTPTSGKRRRSEGANDSGDHSGSTPGAKKDSQKKKKANRACVHCQKAHLTCDDSESFFLHSNPTLVCHVFLCGSLCVCERRAGVCGSDPDRVSLNPKIWRHPITHLFPFFCSMTTPRRANKAEGHSPSTFCGHSWRFVLLSRFCCLSAFR